VTAPSRGPSAEFWEPRYASGDPARGREPNARLVEVVSALALRPGLALDLGCGHGGDALWLASLGWHVTATDVSRTAVGRVATATVERRLRHRVTAEQHDLSRTLPTGTFHWCTPATSTALSHSTGTASCGTPRRGSAPAAVSC
jgi:cyclopropane fatty-acyl-phospholipid synthase-like methyltransferase